MRVFLSFRSASGISVVVILCCISDTEFFTTINGFPAVCSENHTWLEVKFFSDNIIAVFFAEFGLLNEPSHVLNSSYATLPHNAIKSIHQAQQHTYATPYVATVEPQLFGQTTHHSPDQNQSFPLYAPQVPFSKFKFLKFSKKSETQQLFLILVVWGSYLLACNL